MLLVSLLLFWQCAGQTASVLVLDLALIRSLSGPVPAALSLSLFSLAQWSPGTAGSPQSDAHESINTQSRDAICLELLFYDSTKKAKNFFKQSNIPNTHTHI